jgi:hypothetical protein
MDITIVPDKETPPNICQNDDGMVNLVSQRANLNDEAVRQSERLEGTTGVSSTAAFVEEPRVRETIPARSKSIAAPAEASGHLRPAARRGDSIELDAEAEAQNRAAQVSPRV